MMKKLKIIIPVLLLVGAFVGYSKFLKKPPPEPKVHGAVYVLPKEFVLNLKDGRFLKLGVGLVIDHKDTALAGGGGHGAAPPDGYGAHPQEALVRDIVVDHITGTPADGLIDKEERHHLKEEIAKDIREHTDVLVEHVIFTDVAVQ